MNKQELIDAVAAKAGMSKSAIEETINTVLNTISQGWLRATPFSSWVSEALHAVSGRHAPAAIHRQGRPSQSLLRRRSNLALGRPSRTLSTGRERSVSLHRRHLRRVGYSTARD